ncbi:MAG: hypothetical protein COX07_09345 [Bacteroidetes bacterium CG23_combo_of_CG06-09_8_20_14_all_32_9]|nr:MAG: hypothetical protein COX07_09345 [Bacteroidetes bacterium CG23_combo_of_CG06-09_8_20_14_all_32_9]
MNIFLERLNKIIKSKIFIYSLFIIILLVMSYRFNYHKIINYRPQAIHSWRQTDCASQALNYANKDINFFKPQLHCLLSDNYTTGYCTEEFPILYFTVGVLYKIFGFNEFIYRFLVILVYFIGLFYLFKTFNLFISNNYLSMVLTFFSFISPVIIFYTNNFLLNVPALSFTFIGWYYFMLFYKEKKGKHFYIALVLFALASLLKLSEAMSLFVLIGLLVFERIPFIKFKQNKELIFGNFLKSFLLLLIPFFLIFSWYLYASYYNESHKQMYYIFQFNPIWSMDMQSIKLVWENITARWYYEYFDPIMYKVFLACVILAMILFKKASKAFLTILLFYIIGSLGFAMLWYSNLKEHDYYTISFFIAPFFLLLITFQVMDDFLKNLKNKTIRILSYSILIFGLVFLLIQNINYDHKKIIERYNWQYFPDSSFKDLFFIKDYLKEIGVTSDDKVIVLPDMSTCYSLYIIDQPGWTNFLFDYNPEILKKYIEKGAKYIIIVGSEPLQQEVLKPFLTNKVGEQGDITIFKVN